MEKAKAEQPETISLPLRVVLLKHILDVLLTRLEACQKSETSLKEARVMLILDESSNIPYLEWSASQKALQVRKDREPLPYAEAVRILQELQKLVLLPLVVMRCHSTRKLVKEHKGEVLPMMLQLGYRTPEAQRAWTQALPNVRPLTSRREDGPQCPGNRAAQDDLRAVLRLQLPNPSNFCYSNASFLSILWTHYLTPHQGAGTQSCDLLGPSLQPIWSWLRRQARPDMPWQHLAWRALHSGWRQAGEHLAFLKPHLGAAVHGTGSHDSK